MGYADRLLTLLMPGRQRGSLDSAAAVKLCAGVWLVSSPSWRMSRLRLYCFDHSDMLHAFAVAALATAKEDMLEVLVEVEVESYEHEARSATISQKRSLLKDKRRARIVAAMD